MAVIARKFLFILALSCSFFFPLPLHAQEGEIVKSLEVQGNKRVDDSTILYYIKTEVGSPLSRIQIRKDIEQIYSLGQFKDIRVETRSVAGGLEVIFHVVEISSVRDIAILGNEKIGADDIREKISIKRGATFQEHMVQESIEEITNLYLERGYFFAEVKISKETTPENLIDVTIRIREGKKVSVEKIRFVGNKNITDDELRDHMETREETWYSFLDESGIYQKDILKLDVFRIEAFYQDQGYLRVRVLDPKIEVSKKEQEIYITIPVEEGPRFKVAKIEIKGDDLLTSEEIDKAMRTKTGEVYNVSQLRKDILNITELYSRKGYAYADVNPFTQINDENKTVDLTIESEKGRKVYIGEISIMGNTRTWDNVIRREFRFTEGDLFDSEKLKRSKQRINNLRFFEDVKIDTRRGKQSDLIDITTTVTERPTGSLSIGAGFSSIENFVFTASIAQDNLLGRGQRINFSISLSSLRSDFNLNFTEPRLFDSEILLGIDLFNRDTDFLSFNSRNRGGGLRFGKALNEFDWVGLGYRFDDVEISEVEAANVTEFLKNEKRITSRILPSYIRDTRDDFLNPTTGWKHVVGFEVAGGILGGSNFVRMGYDVSYFHPLIGKLVGAVRGKINWAEAYGGDDLPAFERYFLGGPNSLRGYTIRDIGPRGPSGDPIGGNASLLFNIEAQYPFNKTFRGVLFYDRGNVYGGGSDTSTTSRTISLSNMRDSIGAGIRFMSPFGPIGFAYGIKLDKRDGEKAGEFHFSAGSAF